jgi:hypothetical protein
MRDTIEAAGRILLSTKQVGAEFGITRPTLTRWIKLDLIRARKLSRTNFFDREEIERRLTRGE